MMHSQIQKLLPKNQYQLLLKRSKYQTLKRLTPQNNSFDIKWTIYKARRKVIVNLKIDTDKTNIVV